MTELRTVGPSRPGARLCLVCLPYAGGGANVFSGWHAGLPADVEVRAPVLPGREALLGRPPFEELPAYVAALDESITRTVVGRPYALFGHSLGALVAYEVAWRRHRAGRSLPVVLVVAGREPPFAHVRQRNIADLPAAEFIRALARLDGTPRELLHNEELMQLLLPALRADFRISESYQPVKRDRLPVPVLVLTGREDPEVSPRAAAGWAACTAAAFRIVVMHGGHFFLHSQRDQVLAEIARTLDGDLAPLAGAERSS